jgi:hypothetical protein
MLRDIDLLIPEARWADAIGVLRREGYILTKAANTAAQLWRPGGLVEIDIHRELFTTPRGQRLLRGVEVLRESRPVDFGNGALRLPSVEHQIVHLIGHGQISNFNYAYGRIRFSDRLEAAVLASWTPEGVDWEAVSVRFSAAEYCRPLLTFLLSLNDGGLCPVPVSGRIDRLTNLQQRRVALQARSTVMARVSLWLLWCVAMLRVQIRERDAGRPKIIRTLKRLIFERGAGQRMLRILIHDRPRPW